MGKKNCKKDKCCEKKVRVTISSLCKPICIPPPPPVPVCPPPCPPPAPVCEPCGLTSYKVKVCKPKCKKQKCGCGNNGTYYGGNNWVY